MGNSKKRKLAQQQKNHSSKINGHVEGIFDPMAVTWTEKYNENIDYVWSKLPEFVKKFVVAIAITLLGVAISGSVFPSLDKLIDGWTMEIIHKNQSTIHKYPVIRPITLTRRWKDWAIMGNRWKIEFLGISTYLISNLIGDWINILVHAYKQFIYNEGRSNESFSFTNISLESLRLKNLTGFWVGASIVSYGIYFGIGGFLHWYFYVQRRDRPEEWKCQPKKWLSPELERHEILVGSFNLFVNSTITSILACYISNGGYSTIYYDINEYPWWWLILQFPVIFIYQDYATYLLHRLYHTPFLYKHFHKLHHKYKQPTAFSVTAIHPVESSHIQLTLILPIFLIPIHWGPFYIIALYTYYHGIIDHSGVNFKAQWWQPWQPDAIFHDNHHQYFHVNFGFNIYYWDILHGTYRRKDRVYTEEIFYGQGKALSEASKEELQADIDERLSENPLAFRGNKLEYELTDRDLRKHGIAKNRKNKEK